MVYGIVIYGFYTYQPILKNIDTSDNITKIAIKLYPKIFYSNYLVQNLLFEKLRKYYF